MKRIVMLLLVLLLLTGCAAEEVPATVQPTEPPAPTEPPLPWTETVGVPWDADGALLEMPLMIPDALHYSNLVAFDGDLLLWSLDDHLEGIVTVELCVVELDDGSVIAQRDVDMNEYVIPQVLGESLYLCDSMNGQVYELDKNLEIKNQWNVEPREGNWHMGYGDKLYQLDIDYHLTVCDLATGESTPVMESDPVLGWLQAYDGYATMSYYDNDTGAVEMAVLDLTDGSIHDPDFGDDLFNLTYVNGNFLGGKYNDANVYYLRLNDGTTLWIPGTDSQFALLQEGYILETAYDNSSLSLYDMDGNFISSARLTASYNGYPGMDMIWNESLEGYFFLLQSYEQSARLLFWDISKSTGGENLTLAEVPKPDEAMVQLQQRADELSETYGVHILLGEECDTEFADFTASQVTEWERVYEALDILESALSVYPDGFIRQLRYDTIYSIQIQLVCDLWADSYDRQGDGYVAFTQDMWDHHLMVIDIDDSTVDTYYHEFSHIIDSYLEWDAMQREDALFSESAWAQWNPDWFTGYSYDYSIEHELWDLEYFVDGYSTISPTEDRARVMEHAMGGYNWTFMGSEGLRNKLDYYCRCIRDAFDTTGWPETVLWEQLLSLE